MWLCKCDLFRLGYRRNENNVIPAHLSRVTRKGVSEISLHILYALCKLKFYVKPVRGEDGAVGKRSALRMRLRHFTRH